MADYKIHNPLFVVDQLPDGTLYTYIGGDNYRTLALAISDLVRHVANVYLVPEGDVWEYVDKERMRPTTGIRVTND